MLNVSEAVDQFATAIGAPVTLLGSLTGGETGATAVQLADGERRVLKWETDRDRKAARRIGAALAERLRVEADWPVPRQDLVDSNNVLFVSQELMAGDTVTEMTHGLVDDLLRLHQSRLGIASELEAASWGQEQIDILTTGGEGYCMHQPLHDYDDRTRRIVLRIEEIGHSLRPEELAAHDIVHADLHTGNMLQTDGRLAAVIDLDFATAGDAGFDLVFLAAASLEVTAEAGVRTRLFEAVEDNVDARRRLAYAGNLVLRLLDWPIRKGRTEEVEFWLERVDQLLELK